MNKYLKGCVLVAIVVGLFGCATTSNPVVNAIDKRNEQLAQAKAPIRMTYEQKGSGVSFHPYLLGKVAPTVASPVLMKDLLEGIKTHGSFDKISLVQVRRVKLKADSADEVWVVKDTEDEMYAYFIHMAAAGGGTDYNVSAGYRTYKPMLDAAPQEAVQQN